jgi:hypothetical protein
LDGWVIKLVNKILLVFDMTYKVFPDQLESLSIVARSIACLKETESEIIMVMIQSIRQNNYEIRIDQLDMLSIIAENIRYSYSHESQIITNIRKHIQQNNIDDAFKSLDNKIEIKKITNFKSRIYDICGSIAKRLRQRT